VDEGAQRHRLVSDGLGLPRFPFGTEPSSDMGDHVMGVVVLAWLTQHPLERWGPSWAESGSLDARFRAHLTTGVPLTIAVRGDDASLQASITDSDQTLYATATATRPDPTRRPPWTGSGSMKEGAVPSQVVEQGWAPLTFGFDADRDLRFTEGLNDGAFWRERGWAHPAWLASATNAMVRRNFDFETPDAWRNAGLGAHHARPIAHGSTITLTGRIDRLFDRARYRFAVAAITAWVDDAPAASLTNTFTYEMLAP
jgi:hypothetical protein